MRSVNNFGVTNVAKAVKSALSRVLAARKAAGGGSTRVSPVDAERYPLLVEMLTATVYPDGTAREPSRLSVSADREGGGWRTMLKEEGQALVLWSHSDTLEGIMEALESHLGQDEPDWRPDRYAVKDRAKKRS